MARIGPRGLLCRFFRWCSPENHGVRPQCCERILVYHTNIQYSDVILDCVYLAVIEARFRLELPFRTFLLAVHSDGVLAQLFPHYRAVFCFVEAFFRTMLGGVDYSVLVAVGKVGFECCLAGVCLYGSDEEFLIRALNTHLKNEWTTYEQMLFPWPSCRTTNRLISLYAFSSSQVVLMWDPFGSVPPPAATCGPAGSVQSIMKTRPTFQNFLCSFWGT
jgi:hypothetical protein